MQRIGIAQAGRTAGIAAGISGTATALRSGVVSRPPQPSSPAQLSESLYVEEDADGWDVIWQPVTRREVGQALHEVSTLGRARNASLPPLGVVYLEDITEDNDSSVTSDGEEANVAMLVSDRDLLLDMHGTATLETSMVSMLTTLLNDPAVFSSIQSALERDATFQALMASAAGGPSMPRAAAILPFDVSPLPPARDAPVSIQDVLEALAEGITEVASKIGIAFASIGQLLRRIGDSIRLALAVDGPPPKTYGAPGTSTGLVDPRMMLAVSKLAVGIAVVVIFGRISPGMLLRI